MDESEDLPSSNNGQEKKRSSKAAQIAFYGFCAIMGVWFLLSVTLHLFLEKDPRVTRRAIDPRANKPAELLRCWEATYKLFDDLVYDFGHELLLSRKYRRDLKSTWGDRYGWDLVPWSQLAADRLRREVVGPWRWERKQVWDWCRLGDSDVMQRSKILSSLKQAHLMLDQLRVSLTRRMRSFVEPGRMTVDGGDLDLIDSIRHHLDGAQKQVIKLMEAKRRVRELMKLRKWKLKRSKH